MKKFKKYFSLASILGLVFFLSACSNKPITSHSTGLWDGVIVLNFSRAIIWLSKFFGNNYGMGIIIFTIIVRIIILPLMIYQTRSMKKTQEIQPELKKLQKKYSSKDTETMQKLRTEQQKLYSEAGVNPVAGCLPLIVQLPILWALYQGIWRTDILKSGHFLWLQLGHKDPYFIMPILAALFTFISSWLATKSQPEQNGMTKSMTYGMPLIIFFMALNIPAAISIYWVVTNLFQAGQTLVLQNPWKIQKEREEKQLAEKQRKHAVQKAIRKAKRSRRK
ncbi:membrane protein insertase YidC [Apilactobacillus micheneri]|uniref:Membrane protein insertase YidC n=1 Tax=Apilactobacillus micheneri TaxID=1899430 RepID=A0A9Q8ILZ5_9LACO|nr:membrane protein insertase YidC [Apilactobacillus micheneri]TPR26382.1 membrane protein insertase YidC [Apilactobacillus micheneri]TPR27136.1 membrane protein insertase YidC [Apilactobacillus micheneri]TPR27383.1 membrane protein insertase YidC [Apilactobacillus micheneri]TPR31899.1 membrane protein insertase YidC [Apilactobacillus micheneri]TPR32303.1 membrane protein insertase YidC [Apilactobacillus micheneri]